MKGKIVFFLLISICSLPSKSIYKNNGENKTDLGVFFLGAISTDFAFHKSY